MPRRHLSIEISRVDSDVMALYSSHARVKTRRLEIPPRGRTSSYDYPPIQKRNITESVRDYKTDDVVARKGAPSPPDPIVMRTKPVRGKDAAHQRKDGYWGFPLNVDIVVFPYTFCSNIFRVLGATTPTIPRYPLKNE